MDRYRATTSTGAVVDQPGAAQLAELVAEVARSGRDAFLVVEGRSGYLQARRTPTGWTLETSDGLGGQSSAETADVALVCSVLTYWVLRAKAFPGLRWHPRRSADVAGLLAAG